MSITLDAASASADTFEIAATIDSDTLHATAAHSGGAAGTLEISFPVGTPYPSGKTITLTLVAKLAGEIVGQGSAGPTLLSPGCATLNVNLVGVESSVDLSSDDFAPANVDMAGACPTLGTVRCKATDHSFEQLCDSSGQWTDHSCASTSPLYACTEAKNKCIDPAWAQWNHTSSMPNPRFATISTVANEDVIRDLWTGLYWELELPDAKYTLSQAQSYCDGLVFGGFSDWRVPTLIEIQSLVDYTVASGGALPSIQSAFTTFTKVDYYWTSSAFQAGAANAHRIYFGGGTVDYVPVGNTYRVRCVR